MKILNLRLDGCWVLVLLLGMFFETLWLGAQESQPRIKLPIVTKDGQVQIQVDCTLGEYIRLDASTNLLHWLPVDLVRNNGEGSLFVDRTAQGSRVRFYSAVQVAPKVGVIEFEPGGGFPNTRVEIFGQFFENTSSGKNIVSFGGAEAPVLESGTTRLVVLVPTNAVSGPLRITTPTGTGESKQFFTVRAQIPVLLDLPAGLNPADYVIMNCYGGADRSQNIRIAVRKDMPTITMAIPKDTNRLCTFYGLSISATEPLTINALSTAQTLVFFHPHFASIDSMVAANIMTITRADTKVRELADLLEQLYLLPGDPFTNAPFLQAYADAIVSVATNSQTIALANRMAQNSQRQPTLRAQGAANTTADYRIDIEFVEISDRDEDDDKIMLAPNVRRIASGAGPRFPWANSVDWIVVASQIDVDQAFPAGKNDFLLLRNDFDVAKAFPTTGTFGQGREWSIQPDLILGRLNPVKFYMGKLLNVVNDKMFPPEDTIKFPNADALYLIRAIGPGFYPAFEADFAKDQYKVLRFKAMYSNLLAAALDMASICVDLEILKSEKYVHELLTKFAFEAGKKAPTLSSPDDIPRAVGDLTAFVLTEITDKGKEFLIEGASNRLAKAAYNNLSKAVSYVNPVLKVLDIAGSVGQVAQRVNGITSSTPLETVFIAVGNPFKLEILNVFPNAASPGEEITILFKGSPHLKAFNMTKPEEDQVKFEGVESFDGQVRKVTGPDGHGLQTLVVRLPDELTTRADGMYALWVYTQGRSGSINFRLYSKPVVNSMTPRQGFAAVDDFLGKPFSGTKVTLTGLVFNPKDQFLFSGTANGVPASNVSGSLGNVSMYIPKTAQSGPIRIRHQQADGTTAEVETPLFQIIGPPAIRDLTPNHSFVGGGLIMTAENLNNDPSCIAVQFRGAPVSSGALMGPSSIFVGVPNQAQTGPITLLTPAGSAQIPFTLESITFSSPVAGAKILVGGDSVVTLSRALQFAIGGDFPLDDWDYKTNSSGVKVSDDPPYEEGDFVVPDRYASYLPRWPVGKSYQDTIALTGTFTNNLTFTNDFDTISGGTIVGDTVIAGSLMTFNTTILGSVVVVGDSNNISGSITGTVVIRGRFNTITATITGSLTVLGDYNRLGIYPTPSIAVILSPTHGAVIRGMSNQVCGTFRDNAGDGLRFEGGCLNEVLQAYSYKNGGNGITLTNGANYNRIKFDTVNPRATSADMQGNRMHGLALLGNASFNSISILKTGASFNEGDGAYLDGSGVTGNKFEGFLASKNRGNGIILTNSPTDNFLGVVNISGLSSSIRLEENGKNGIALFGARKTQVCAQCRTNLLSGVLVSGVNEAEIGDTIVLLNTGGTMGSKIYQGNTAAGIRLEKGTRNVRVLTMSSGLVNDGIGLEIDGGDVSGNDINVDISRSVTDGAVISEATGNRIYLDISLCGSNGCVLSGAKENTLFIYNSKTNGNNGLLLTDGASANRVIDALSLHGNRNGIVLQNGARQNFILSADIHGSREHGVLIQDNQTYGNQLIKLSVADSAGDGLKIEKGAHGNVFGQVDKNRNPHLIPTAYFYDCATAAVHITGTGTRDNQVLGCLITQVKGTRSAGVVIEDHADSNIIRDNTINNQEDGIIVRGGARQIRLVGNICASQSKRGILITNANEVFIGGSEAAEANEITQNDAGIELSGLESTRCVIQQNTVQSNKIGVLIRSGATLNTVGPANIIQNNTTGIAMVQSTQNIITRNIVRLNSANGIAVSDWSSENQLIDNQITENGTGIAVTGSESVENAIVHNAVWNNQYQGISLDQNANRGIPAPVLTMFDGGMLEGKVRAPDGSRIEIFQDIADEGKQSIAMAMASGGMFRAELPVDPAQVGMVYRITATVTDPDGNTSPFSQPLRADQPLVKLAFVSNQNGNSEIYLLDPINFAPAPLAISAAQDDSPCLSPAGDKLLFVSDRSGNRQIYLSSSMPGNTPKQLTVNSSSNEEPVWAKNAIVFVSYQDGNPEIYSMDTNGSNWVRLTTSPFQDRHPTISPDGTKIAFSSNRSGHFQIYVMNADGSEQRAITRTETSEIEPAWSPDGSLIAFVSERDGNPEVYTLKPDGSEVLRITADPAKDHQPAWLPGSQTLVFSSNRSGNSEIFKIPRAGGIAYRINLGTGDNSHPAAGMH